MLNVFDRLSSKGAVIVFLPVIFLVKRTVRIKR